MSVNTNRLFLVHKRKISIQKSFSDVVLHYDEKIFNDFYTSVVFTIVQYSQKYTTMMSTNHLHFIT